MILIISCYRISVIPLPNTYQEKEQTITGIVTNYEKKKDYTVLEVQAKEKIMVKDYQKQDVLLGDQVKVTGPITYIQGTGVFNLFRYDLYMRSKNIYYQCNNADVELLKRNPSMMMKLKQSLIHYFMKFQSSSYLRALLLGDDSGIKDEIKTLYQSLGISHVLALSGMHVSILSGILLYIFKKLNIQRIGTILVSIFLFFYLILTGFSPSLIRAVSLTIIYFFSIPIQKKDALLLLCSIMLIYQPYYLCNPGFLYSFIISFFLISFPSKEASGYKRILKTSILAFSVSFPITLYFFFEVNVLSIITNIICVPIFSSIIFPFAILTSFIPQLDFLYTTMIYYFEELIKLCSNLTFMVTFPRVSIIYYIGYEILIYLILNTKRNYFIFIIGIFLLLHYYNTLLFGTTKLTVLDVGQGDSFLLEFGHQQGNVLIDTGGIVSWNHQNSFYYAESKIIPYLKSEGIQKLDTLVISHGDYDHMGEAINLVNNFKVEKVIFNCGPHNDLENELIKVLNNKKIKYYSCIKELNIGNNKLHFLNTREYDNENDNSNVIYTELNNYKFLFMGDASTVTEKEILGIYNLPNIDVLKVGHHGSKTSSSKEFINTINPKYSIISVGKNNRYGHPNKEVLDNLNNSKIYRTDIEGSIMFKIKKGKLDIGTCPP